MDLYPGARRVLLTAYADTDAAIDAINVVDLDHYLLKPWDPPEEKLYPVVDDLLEAWRAADHRPVPRPRWSGTAGRRARRRCGSSWPATRCPTAGTPSDEPEGRRLLAAAGADGAAAAAGGHRRTATALVEPSDPELAAQRRAGDHAGRGLLRPGRHRRRPGRARRRRVRGLRGAAHRAGRADGDRRAGRAELTDRELPRLPRRGVRGAAHRPGAAAGRPSSAPRSSPPAR